MTIGQHIKAARKKAGMTQSELAHKLNIPFQSISQWERDIRNPKLETLQRIAIALDTPLSDLTGTTIKYGKRGQVVSVVGYAEDLAPFIDEAKNDTSKIFHPFTKADAQLIELGGFPAIAEFYSLPEEAQKKALEDIRGFAEFVIDKYKKQAADDK